jgi:hypothetical protein
MHDGSIQAADSWLRNNLDAYVQWAKSNNSLLVLTFDEDDNGPDNHVATFFWGPMVTPGQYPETVNHDNLLRTLEDLYGLGHAGNAANAAAIADIWAGGGPAPAAFTISASAGAGGLISPSGSISAARGASLTFTITASAGYAIAAVRVDGVDQGALSSYTFSNVTANHGTSITSAAGRRWPPPRWPARSPGRTGMPRRGRRAAPRWRCWTRTERPPGPACAGGPPMSGACP